MSHRTKPVLILSVIGLLAASLWLGTSYPSQAAGTTYYLSPSGSNANAGTSTSAPWKTFAYAIPELNAGDTLILMDGEYNGSNSGYPNIDCSGSANNGNAANHVILKAQHERQAYIHGAGDTVFRVSNCNYWTFEGLRYDNGNFAIRDSHNIIVRRTLAEKSNFHMNQHLLFIAHSSNILAEENEYYNYHRKAINTNYSSFVTMRRNYGNSRDYPIGEDTSWTGLNEFISIYPGSDSLVENNIAERSHASSYNIEATANGDRNRFFGNISYNDWTGMLFKARGTGADSMPKDNIIENQVVINPTSYAINLRGNKNTQCRQCSMIGGNGGLATDIEGTRIGDGWQSVFFTNALAVNTTRHGFRINDMDEWQLDYVNAFSNATNFSPPASDPHITNETTNDPQLGTCRVFIPPGSPMKGADIGANILYVYENGTLTTKPLWNPDPANGAPKGSFPCGATVNGVNNIPGQSCFDVHTRLNVNANSCNLPASYSGSWPPNPGPLPCITGCPTPSPTPSGSPTPTSTPIPKPIITLQAVPTTLIFPGQSSYMLWSALHATSCTASGAWSGPKPLMGTAAVAPSVTSTYTLTCTGPGGTASASITITVGSTGYCHQYTSGSPIPPGFGVPWDVMNPATLLLKAQCTGIGATLELGDNHPYTYIYKNAYVAKSGSSGWAPVSLIGPGLISSTWYPRQATAIVSMTDAELAQPSHYVGYVCKYTGTAWKCGCRDQACMQSYWQLQQFKR